MLLDGVDDLLPPPLDLGLILPLEHHPEQRLGAGVADEQPAGIWKTVSDSEGPNEATMRSTGHVRLKLGPRAARVLTLDVPA